MYGFLTRGCPRGCSFCHVAPKEGKKSVKVANVNEFWNGQKRLVLCDPNILACPDWEDLLKQVANTRAIVDFNQGLDARMLTPEKIAAINKLRFENLHFAWDRYEDKDVVLPKLKLYAEHAKRRPHGYFADVYVLVNHGTTIEQDFERVNTLREMGYWAYIMVYDKAHAAKVYTYISRWVNDRQVFAKCKTFGAYLDKMGYHAD